MSDPAEFLRVYLVIISSYKKVLADGFVGSLTLKIIFRYNIKVIAHRQIFTEF